MIPRRSLTGRVLAVLAVATILPTVVVGYLAIRRAQDDLEREVVRGNLALIRALGAQLDGTLQSARRSLELAAAAWADGRSADTVDDEAGRRATERLLRRLRREVPVFSSLSILTVGHGAGDEVTLLQGDPIAPDAGIGANTFGGYIGDATFEDGRTLIRVVAQARSRTGELVGVFVAHLDLQFISEALSGARLGRGARILVVDGDGIPVARSDGQPITPTVSLRGSSAAVDRALASTTEGSLESGGMVSVYRNLSSYQTLRGVRWAIILEQPAEDAYALATKTRDDTIIAGLVVLAVALLGGMLLAARLTRPLRQLAQRVDAVAGDDHDDAPPPPAPLDAPGEIGWLAHRFEEMARRIGEREKLQAALARGDRLATVGTMAASVAHEVNNPLTTVLGYAKLLLEDKGGDHPDRAGLELIADEAARMKTIVGSMLDYSRSERAPLQDAPTEINESVKKTVALLLPQLRRAHVEVALELAEPLPPVAADRHAVQQVLVNLAQNAAQAMPDGGTLSIETRLTRGDVAVEVCVADTGPGVPPADRARVFEAFYTTKAAGAGTGLGLAVVKHLITSARGSVDIDDAPGGGARFRITLPVAE